MPEPIVDQTALLRMTAFIAVLVLMLAWERIAPLRPATIPGWRRRAANLGLAAIGTLLLRLMPGIAAAGAAARFESGLLHRIGLPAAVEVAFALLVLDLALYWQHRAFHALPVLWRLHRVHHTDPDFDTTTGVRFHPLELILSMGYKALVAVAIGASPAVVVAFELVLSCASLFNHGNVRLPVWLERFARLLLVTPDVHRVHHSCVRAETDSNFGSVLPWWDRLFGSWCPRPTGGQHGMRLGLDGWTAADAVGLAQLLIQPVTAGRSGNAPPS
ncbi:MAG: sterol desaturase family protein [Gammaproteobacteria bacterium]